MSSPIICTPQDLIQMLRSSTTLRGRLEVIAVFANAGLQDLIPELEVIISDVRSPPVMKVKAISALRKMASKAPRKVGHEKRNGLQVAWTSDNHFCIGVSLVTII